MIKRILRVTLPFLTLWAVLAVFAALGGHPNPVWNAFRATSVITGVLTVCFAVLMLWIWTYDTN